MNFIQRYQPTISWVNELDRFFDRNLFPSTDPAPARQSFHESDDAWILRLDLPGYSREDVKLTVIDRTLHLTAETTGDRPFAGRVEHQWKLGEDVNQSAIAARLENGVLELTIPKQPKPEPQTLNIEIN